jgi:MscS family membrane protein
MVQYDFIWLRELLLNWLSLLPGGEVWSNKYIFSILIVFAFIIFAQLIQFLGAKYLEKIAKKTSSKLDDLILQKTKHPLFLVIIVLGLKLGLANIGITGSLTYLVNSILAILFLLLLSRSVDVAIETWGMHFAKITRTKVDEVLLPLFHKFTKVIFVIVGFMWVLHLWGIDITPYLAGVGISGLVLGLALQDSLKNIFGGISLILDKTFNVGDRIKLDSGEVGVVHEVGLRSTKIVTLDNQALIVPNGYLANARVINFAQPDNKIRINVTFGVTYGTSAEKVKKVVLDTVSNLKHVMKEPAPSIQFVEMGDFSLKFKVNFWVDKYDMAFQNSMQSEATEAIYNALNKAKIGIPFPTQTVYLKKK